MTKLISFGVLMVALSATSLAADLNKDLLNAVVRCQVEKARDLLKRGADINARNKHGSAVLLAIRNCEALAPDFLNAGANYDDAVADLQSYILVWSLVNNKSEHTARLVAKGVTAQGAEGAGAMREALRAGNEALYNLLLSHKATMPSLAAIYAVQSGNMKLLKDVLDRGARIEACESIPKQTGSGLNISIDFRGAGDPGPDALMIAVTKGNLEMFRELLARGANPFDQRVYSGGMLDNKDMLSIRPKLYASSLDVASAMGHAKILELILQRRINPDSIALPLTAAALGRVY